MKKATERKNLLSMIEDLEYKLSTYDSTYSDADDFVSKQDLENNLFRLQEKLKEIEKV